MKKNFLKTIALTLGLCFCLTGCGQNTDGLMKEFDFGQEKDVERKLEALVEEQEQKNNVETDIETAENIFVTINVAFSDGIYEDGTTEVFCMPDGSEFPKSNAAPNSWRVYLNENGVCKITLGDVQIWPDPAEYRARYE